MLIVELFGSSAGRKLFGTTCILTLWRNL